MTAQIGMSEAALAGEAVRGVTATHGTAKARIERAALALFAAHGVDGTSIREIAARAGLSEGSIYKNFDSKDALAEVLFEAIHARLHALVQTAIAESADFPDAVRRVAAAYCEAADSDRELFEYHLTHMFRFGRTDRPGRPDPTALIAARIEEAMKAGDCPPGDAEIKAAAALGVVLQPAAHRMAGRFAGALARRSDALARAALAALKEA